MSLAKTTEETEMLLGMVGWKSPKTHPLDWRPDLHLVRNFSVDGFAIFPNAFPKRSMQLSAVQK